MISNYVLSILIIQIFSKEDYGLYVYGLSIFMLLSVILKLGIDVHFVKIFSQLKAKVIPKWVKKVDRSVFLLASVICIILGVLLYYKDSVNTSFYALIFFIASVPFFVKVLLNSGKLRGRSKIVQFAFLNITGRVLLTLIVFIVLIFAFSIKEVHAIYISHAISIVLLFFISLIWTHKEFSKVGSNASNRIPDGFFKYNRGLLFKSYITVFFLWGDRFLLSLVSNSTEVAQYDISLKIAMLIMIVVEAIKSTYAPVFAKYVDDPINLEKEIRKSTRVGFVFSFLIFIIIVILGKFILSLFGAEFEASYPVLLVISFGYTLASFFGQADNILEMCGLIKHYIRAYFIVIFLSLALGVILSKSQGALGMAIGFSLGNIFFQAVASYIVRTRIRMKTSFL